MLDTVPTSPVPIDPPAGLHAIPGDFPTVYPLITRDADGEVIAVRRVADFADVAAFLRTSAGDEADR